MIHVTRHANERIDQRGIDRNAFNRVIDQLEFEGKTNGEYTRAGITVVIAPPRQPGHKPAVVTVTTDTPRGTFRMDA